jgi:hypothetical protein
MDTAASLRKRKLRRRNLLRGGVSPQTEQHEQSIQEFASNHRKAERFEAIGSEVIKRLEAAIASITAVLRRK